MRILVTDTQEWIAAPLAVLDRVKRGGYTDIAVSAWHAKGARWFSPSVSWDPTVVKPRYDPFGIFLSCAKEVGVRVWASFACGIQQLPSLHPEWTYQQATQWTRAFDWTIADFRAWIAGVIQDYFTVHPGTPGLFLDYVRFWDAVNGPLAGDSDGRVTVVTEAVQDMLLRVRAINPAVVSMSFSNVDRLYPLHRSQGNDGRLWLQQGLIQHANCPAYDPDPRTRLANIAADTADLPSGQVAASIATYTTGTQPRTPGALMTYTESQQGLFQHVSHYFYPTLSEKAAACLGASL